VPVSDTERTFAIIGMLLGGGYFGYIIATMASLVSKLDASTAAYHNKMDAIVSYMKSRNLPRELQMRIRKYYKHYLEKKTAFDESRMLSELSTFLRQEVAMFLINDTLFKIPIFRDRDPTFVADLITVLKPLTCSEGDFIMREGEFGREMFVLIRGELEVLHDGHPLALLGPGSYFGEMSVLYVAAPHTRLVRACSCLPPCGWVAVALRCALTTYLHAPQLSRALHAASHHPRCDVL